MGSGAWAAVGRQLRLYLWKNGLQKSRNPGQLLCELCTPIVMVSLFALLYTKVNIDTIPATTFECDMTSISNTKYDFVYLPRLLNMTVQQLGVVGPQPVRSDFIAYLNQYYPGLDAGTAHTLQCSLLDVDAAANSGPDYFPSFSGYIREFDTEAELETYIAQDNYGMNAQTPGVYAAVVFTSTAGRGSGQWHYRIRSNATAVPDTHSLTNDLQRDVTLSNIRQYMLNQPWGSGGDADHTLPPDMPGFVPLQTAVDKYIINSTASAADAQADQLADFAAFAATWNCSGMLSNSSSTQTALRKLGGFLSSHALLPQRVRVAPFPIVSFRRSDFYTFVQNVFALVFVMSFFFPSFFLIRGMVVEKETKIREGMRMMGMGDLPLYAAWYITYGLLFFIIASIIAIIVKAGMFSHSDGGIIILYFWLFGMTAVSLCFMISVFFSRAKLASIVGAVLFIATFFPYFSVNDPLDSSATKAAASLCSPVAFGLALDILAALEANQVGLTWANAGTSYNNFTFNGALAMMAIDFLLYTVLGWYLGKIVPQEFGITLPWYFPFTKSYWLPDVALKHTRGSSQRANDGSHNRLLEEGVVHEDAAEPAAGEQIEAPGVALRDLAKAGRSLALRSLCKSFQTPDGVKKAVDNLSLDMFEGQIFVLLGHNGAGKTTTISMLTGLIPVDAGDAYAYGNSVTEDMASIRQFMGVCPQHDVLFPDLTVREHLMYFSGLKGLSGEKMQAEVNTTIRDVGLSEKVNTYSKDLSGGQKRKLSLGCALIGGSKLVYLDEPTSGMDPFSRRSTWNLLQSSREGRIIILSTHYMDEADILGDRIGIMAHGQIQCCGSSMFLKKRYGVGYCLSIVKAPISDSAAIEQLVSTHVADYKLLSNIGSEMSFQIPLGASDAFPALFAAMESMSKSLGIQSYGISVTTLEEVFLKVAEEAPPNVDAASGKDVQPLSSADVDESRIDTFVRDHRAEIGIFWRHFGALFRKRLRYALRDRRAVVFQLLIPVVALLAGLALLHQVNTATRPAIALGMQAYNPDLPSITGTPGSFPPNYIPYYSTPEADYMARLISTSGSGPGGVHFPGGAAEASVMVPATGLATSYPDSAYPWNGTNGDCLSLSIGDGLPALAIADLEGLNTLPDMYALSMWLLQTQNGSESSSTPVEGGASRYGAFVVSALKPAPSQQPYPSAGGSAYAAYSVLVNTTAYHMAPTMVNMMDAGLLNWVSGGTNASIAVDDAPLPFTKREGLVVSSITSFVSVLFIVIAFSFIPASFAVFVVREREVSAKHQQLISGVSIPAYWLSTYLFDVINYLVPCSVAIALIAAFDVKELIGSALGATIALFFTFGTSVASFTYLMSYLFTSHSTAQTMTLILNLLCLVLLLASFVMQQISSTCDVDAQLKFLYRLFPGYSLGNGLMQLSLLAELPFLETDCGRLSMLDRIQQKFSPLDLKVAGWPLLFMVFESIGYFALAMLVDVLLSYPAVRARFFPDKNRVDKPYEEDSDVAAETARVQSGAAEGDVIVVDHLRKVYNADKIAVRNLSFGIPRGECFGFLGTNGAGKSSTLKILGGDLIPTSGTARLSGHDILQEQIEVRRLLGYCPQFDALLDLLTVREHLELFARIKGVPSDILDRVVRAKIHELDLDAYEHKLAGSLSGGNKRKLCVAIAMIGAPPLVLLDEPSSGMDPVARRQMWRVIARAATETKKCSIVLCTHHMEEAEALCSRIGIMVGGRLRCLGSSQHLKSKFGKGYLAVFKVAQPDNARIEKALAMLQPYLEPPPNMGTPPAVRVEPVALGTWRLPTSQLHPVCVALGDATRARMVHPNSTGWSIAAQLQSEGSVDAQQFAEWWCSESLAAILHQFVIRTFAGSQLMERHGEFLRYRIPASGMPLSQLFGLIESNKHNIYIVEYSLSQVSLESIFNGMAAQQEEERQSVRGMVKEETAGGLEAAGEVESAADTSTIMVADISMAAMAPKPSIFSRFSSQPAGYAALSGAIN